MSRTKQTLNTKPSSKTLKKEQLEEEIVEEVEETMENVDEVEETEEIEETEEVTNEFANTNKDNKTSIFDKINRKEIENLENNALSDVSNETLLQALYLRGLDQQNPTIYHTARKALEELNLTLIPKPRFSNNHRGTFKKFNSNRNPRGNNTELNNNGERFSGANNHYERRKPGTSNYDEDNVRNVGTATLRSTTKANPRR